MTETILFRSLSFVYWNLFVIWCLEFGASFRYVLFDSNFIHPFLLFSSTHPGYSKPRQELNDRS
jgi:hypothetical protein